MVITKGAERTVPGYQRKKGAGEKVKLMICLLCKHKDVNLDIQDPCKIWTWQRTAITLTEEAETGYLAPQQVQSN